MREKYAVLFCHQAISVGAGILFLMAGQASAQSANTANRDATLAKNENAIEVLMLTSQAFREAVEKIRPALVTIESFGGVSAVQGEIGGIRQQGEGNTTGIMVSPDGWVVTSTFNFIQQPPIITVITSDGERRVAKLVGRDETRKICLLKIDGITNAPIPEMVDPDQLNVGDWAISVGVGFGDTNPAMSAGIISAKNRIGGRAIQTDANTSPACYGGPLIDIHGRMIGICVPLSPQSQAIGAGVEWYDSGIGFAVPLFDQDSLLARLQQGEMVRPAFLGIEALPDPGGKGLWIEQVVSKSAADNAGLKHGDVITQVGETAINDLLQLKTILSRFEAGQTIQVSYIPENETQAVQVDVTLGTATPEQQPSQLEPPKIR